MVSNSERQLREPRMGPEEKEVCRCVGMNLPVALPAHFSSLLLAELLILPLL